MVQWPRNFKDRSGWIALLWVGLTAILEALLEWVGVIDLPAPLDTFVPTAVGAVRFWFYHQRTRFIGP